MGVEGSTQVEVRQRTWLHTLVLACFGGYWMWQALDGLAPTLPVVVIWVAAVAVAAVVASALPPLRLTLTDDQLQVREWRRDRALPLDEALVGSAGPAYSVELSDCHGTRVLISCWTRRTRRFRHELGEGSLARGRGPKGRSDSWAWQRLGVRANRR